MSSFLPILLLLSVPVNFSVREPFSVVVEQAIRENAISLEDGLRFREWAVRNPQHLPEPWRTQALRHPIVGWAATGILVENFQIRKRMGLRDQDGFPEPMPLHLDSDQFPIRVEYPSDDYVNLAQAVLIGAEIAWQKEIVEWGFFAPPHVTAENPYRILVGDTGMQAAGYMAPVDFWPDTPWDDCTSWIMIDWRNDPSWVRATVAHELSHATQGAMDCLEYMGFWENTSTFIEGQVEPELGVYFQNVVLDYYQVEPHRSVSAGAYMDYYWYGGFFWPQFLASVYRTPEEEPAVFVRKIWQGAMQHSDGYNNIPNYMQSIDSLLQQRASNINEAYQLFAWQRFLVGNFVTSLSKIQWAERYHAIPPTEGEIVPSTAGEVSVSQGHLPQAYGANYWYLSLPSGYKRQIRIRLTSQERGPWSLVLFHPLWNDVTVTPLQDQEVEVVFTPKNDTSRPFFGVVRGATETFDPENLGAGADYHLEYGPVVPDPVVHLVMPFEHEQGDQVLLTVQGQYFQEGVTVRFIPEGIVVYSVVYINDGDLKVEVRVDDQALLGAYQMEVINPDGGKAILERAVYVHAQSEKPVLDGNTTCQTMPGRRRGSLFDAIWLIALIGWVRRRYH